MTIGLNPERRYSRVRLGSTTCCTTSTSTTARCSRQRCSWREAAARMFSAPGSWLSQLPGANTRRRRVRAPLPAGQALREADVRDRRRSSSTAPGAGRSKQTVLDAAVLPPAAVQAPTATIPRSSPSLQATIRRCWWSRRCPATTPRCCATRSRRCSPTTTSTSPTGSTRAWCRPTEGAFTLDDYVGYVREFIRHIGAERLHVLAVCQPAVPGAGGGRADRGRGRARAAQPDADGRPDRRAPQPDPGQRLRHQQAAALVRDQPAPRGARPATRAAAAASIPGFLQHAGFMAMNPVRHMSLALDFFHDLVRRRRSRAPTSTAASTTSTTPCSTCRPSTTSTACASCSSSTSCRAACGASRGDRVAPEAITRRGADDHRGRAGRHLGHRPDARRPRSVHRHPGRTKAPPDRRRAPATTASSAAAAGARSSTRRCATSSPRPTRPPRPAVRCVRPRSRSARPVRNRRIRPAGC